MKKLLFLLLAVAITVTMVFSVSATEAAESAYDKWVENAEPITDYAFTVAFVGDTQKITEKNPEYLPKLYDWIVSIAEEKNLQFVAGMGDITDNSTVEEWDVAVKSIAKLNGIVPYTMARGNHDYNNIFSLYMNKEEYTSQLSGMYNDDVLNVYNEFTVGTLKYLVFVLDHGAGDGALNWASEIIAAHPDHNVIITTHGYMLGDGQLITRENSDVPPTRQGGQNDGPAIFEKLISKHENIVMVACGHITTCPELLCVEATGDNGNKIQQVLIDPSKLDMPDNGGPAGMVALMYFSADGKLVQVENYSTAKGIHYGEGLTFTLNSVGGNALENPFNPLPYVIAGAAALVVAGAIVMLIAAKKKKAVIAE